MYELVVRIDLVAHACEGRLNLAPPYAREYCYLQFRRMCELIALGCLQLHGDLPSARSGGVAKEWHAEKIMRRLQKEHPHSFPQCVSRSEVNGIANLIANSKPNALSFTQFRSLYHECGEALHRGTIKSIGNETHPGPAEYERLLAWQARIVDLMNQNFVARSGTAGLYFVTLKSENGLPACSVFSKFSEGTIEIANYNLTLEEDGNLKDEFREI